MIDQRAFQGAQTGEIKNSVSGMDRVIVLTLNPSLKVIAHQLF